MVSKKSRAESSSLLDLKNNYDISFTAGLMSGATVAFLSFLIPYALEKKWVHVGVGFVIYVIIGISLYFFGLKYVQRKFEREGKKR